MKGAIRVKFSEWVPHKRVKEKFTPITCSLNYITIKTPKFDIISDVISHQYYFNSNICNIAIVKI